MQERSERSRWPDGLEPDPVIELHKRDVDCTLVREQLRRSAVTDFEALIDLNAVTRPAPRRRRRDRQAAAARLSYCEVMITVVREVPRSSSMLKTATWAVCVPAVS